MTIASDRGKRRLDRGDLRARPRRHQRQRPLGCPGHSAAHRAVDLHDPFFLEQLEDTLGHDRAGGREIDEAPYTLAFDDAALAGCNLEHDLGRGQARHHGFRRVGDLADGARRFRAHRGEPVDGLAPGVEHDEAVTRLEEPARHMEAHLAQPNKADIHRNPSLRADALCASI